MEKEKTKYQFSTKAYEYSSSADMCGWTFVSLPKKMSIDIRNNFQHLEEGWGRMKVTAKIKNSEWQTAIWFDTKQDTYLLPLKAQIRKEENIVLNENIEVAIWI